MDKIFSLRSTKNIIFLLGAITLAVYIWTLPNNFVWDDEEQVVHNTAVHQLGSIPSFFAGSTFQTGGAGGLSGIYYKPLMTTSFAILYKLGGGQPWIFHLFQVLMHVGNVILVFLIFRELLNKKIAAVLAALFALHPLNVESVVYISALQDTQFFFFGALALYAVMKYKKLDFLYGKAIPGLLLLASLLSKETGVVMVGVYALYVLIFGSEKKFTIKDYFIHSCNAAGALGAYLVLRFAVAQVEIGTQGLSPITTISAWERILSAPKILFYYLSNFVFPWKLAIAQHWVVSSPNWQDFLLPLFLTAIFIGASVFFGVKLFRKSKKSFRLFTFYFLSFWGAMLLHLHVVPLDMTVADRWFYLPMMGLLGMIGVIWQNFVKAQINRGIFQRYLPFVLAGILLLLSFRSVVRIRDWRDGLTLFSHDIVYSKNAFDLENNLGTELMRAGRTAEAKPHFERSTELLPNWWTNWNNLGVVYQREGNDTKAKEYYQRAIDNGEYYLAYENMAALLHREEGAESANEFVTESLRKLPYNPRLNYFKAVTEYELGNKKEAVKYARLLFQLSPSQESRALLEQIMNSEDIEE